MFIGKWNKSVILTYIGMAVAVAGIFLSFTGIDVKYAFVCLMVAGICDLFDGAVARKCKRTEEEKAFGVELDSLADTVSFVVFPIVLFLGMGLTHYWHIPIYILFAIAGVARLGYFNIITADKNNPVKHYTGLPVTFSALIFPLLYLLKPVMHKTAFMIFYSVMIGVVAICQILKIKIPKPKGIAYAIFAILAIVMLVVFIVFL